MKSQLYYLQLFLLFLISMSSYNMQAQTQYQTLNDTYGNRIRATPIAIGLNSYMNESVAFAKNVDNWKTLKSKGINTVRICWVDPWYRMNGQEYWNVDQVIPLMDQLVSNATESNMNIIINYHNVAEYQKTRGFGIMAEFWRKIAPRYKNNSLVLYELNNEQAWSVNDYISNQFKNNMKLVYDQVRNDAPDRQIILFSFHSLALDMKLIADNYNWINWDYTSIGWHFYGNPSTNNISLEEKNLKELLNTYRTICTEWDYPNTHNYVKEFFNKKVNSEALEDFGISWSDWRSWNDISFNEFDEILIPDAKNKGYYWLDNNTDQSPFAIHKIPGIIQAEFYDNGGQGIAYSDNESTNLGGQGRIDEGVDIENTTDVGNGTNIGWIEDGEWLEYTIKDIEAGSYNIIFRVASISNKNKSITIKIGNTNLGEIAIPNTNGWQSWETISLKNIPINEGNNQQLRLTLNGGAFNLNWIQFQKITDTNKKITVRTRGSRGDEKIRIMAGNIPISEWTLNTTLNDWYTETKLPGNIKVEFLNDNGPRDVFVDYITINETVYQSEKQIINTAVWQNNSCGGSNSDWLHCNGYIEYKTATPDKLPETRKGNISVYPNPAQNQIIIEGLFPKSKIWFVDISGRKIDLKKNQTDLYTSFDISMLKPGVYFLISSLGHQKRFVKN